jgi:hypothetical protein
LEYEDETKIEFDARWIDLVGLPDLGSATGRQDTAIDVRGAPGGVPNTKTRPGLLLEGKAHMSKKNRPAARIKLWLGIVLLAVSAGCIVPVGGGYDGPVVVPGPDLFLFGGGYDRGHDVHAYSHRGFESRAAAHGGGGHGGRR